MKRANLWIAGAVALMMTACGAEDTSDSSGPIEESAGADRLALAKKEGEVNFYYALDEVLGQALADDFTQQTGIKVNLLAISGSEQITRILQEAEAGVNEVDVNWAPNESDMLTYAARGLLAEDFRSSEHDNLLPTGYTETDEGAWYNLNSARYLMAYNTDLVTAEEAPTSYADLADPKWKDKIVHTNPRTSGGAALVGWVIAQEDGWDVVEAIGQNELLLVGSSGDVPRAVISGERPIAMLLTDSILYGLIQDREPVAPIFPDEGTLTVTNPAMVFENAPHPNAARVFLDYLLSQKAQQMMIDVADRMPVRSDVELPDGYWPPEDDPLLPDFSAYIDEQADAIDRFEQYLG